MKTWVKYSCSLLLVSLIRVGNLMAQSPSDPSMVAFTSHMENAFNTGNATELAKLFTADAAWSDASGVSYSGNKAIEAHYDSVFKQYTCQIRVSVLRLIPLPDKQVYCVIGYDLLATRHTDGAVQEVSGKMMCTLLENNLSWQVGRMTMELPDLAHMK